MAGCLSGGRRPNPTGLLSSTRLLSSQGSEDVETVITVSVIIAMIMPGVLLIHLLNGRHNERIAAFHYGDALPGAGRRSRKSR